MRPVFRLCTAVAVLGASLAPTACGDDEEDGDGGQAAQPRTVEFRISGSGRQPKMTAPKSVEGGVVRVRFSNDAKGEHGLQFGYVEEGNRTPQDALRAAAAWGEGGKRLPDWVHLQGGVGSIGSGTSQSVTQELPAGRYFAVDIDSNATAFFEVTGGGGGEEPSAPATVEASEYKFEASGLQEGRQQLVLDNIGAEPHLLLAAPIKEGKTIEDVRRFAREEKGDDPLVEEGSFDTAIVDGGVKQVVQGEFRAGTTYALICFIPDRKGGPPHALKGMISEATVE
jgi:hypothetical protein